MKGDSTWEEAVEWLRGQADQQELVRACYYDDPLVEAADRFFRSEEWAATRRLLPPARGRALDLGAGRGISSVALAREGWSAVALEPDSSDLVGAGAIRALAADSRQSVAIVEGSTDELPFRPGSFDLVYGRQVMHHAPDLSTAAREAARVLKSGGRFVAVREHVISRREELRTFLDAHPLHRFYGGENAYLLQDYTGAFTAAGLRMTKVLGSFDSPINYFPLSTDEWRDRCRKPMVERFGRLGKALSSPRHFAGRWLTGRLALRLSAADRTPGRLYSFVAEKA